LIGINVLAYFRRSVCAEGPKFYTTATWYCSCVSFVRGTGPRGATPSSGGMCASVLGLRSFCCELWNKPETKQQGDGQIHG